jgi:hypothetical protein
MRLFALLLLAVMCLACTHVVPASDPWAAFAANERSVGFGNLWVGMSHSDAERALARTLTIEDDSYSDACGSGRSTIEVAGAMVSIQWADEQPREIEAMFVKLPVQEVAGSRKVLARAFGRWVSSCDSATSDNLAACFRHPRALLVLAETAPEWPGVRLIMEDCTD